MWIGDVPLPLKILSLPERILVARFFPTTYIVKLYPKKKGARAWALASSLHSGLQSNVSMYRLNTDQIAHMLCDHVMPPPSSVLAAMIRVMFVGPRNVPEKTMLGFLHVNHARVHLALCWLKTNNPIYHNIVISESRLDELLEDGIPHEIWSLTKHSNDAVLLEEERDGYVPEDPKNEDGLCQSSSHWIF